MQPFRTLGLAALALALGVAFAAPAEARDHNRRGHDRSHSSQDWRRGHDRRADHRRDHRRGDRKHDRRQDRRYDRPDTRVVYVPRPVVVHHPSAYRGPPPWARGRHYGYGGYAPTYVVNDYRPYGLHHPPRGHHWRRSDAGDFLLVAIATGIIADVILGR
ncbi:RcnB family protein [Luteimonas sp. A649]